MKASRRLLAIVGVLAGLALVTAALTYVYRSSIAVALAPMKSADTSQSELAKSANTKFWEAFHGGRYDEIPVVLESITVAYLQNPRDTETAAHIAFTHVWALNEGARRESRPIDPSPRSE